MKMFKDVSDCLEHHIHQRQTINCDSSAFFQLRSAFGTEEFHATNKFATHTHVKRKKDTTNPSPDAETIAKVLYTKHDHARPSTSNTITISVSHVLITRRRVLTNEPRA